MSEPLPQNETLTVDLSPESLRDSPDGKGPQRFAALAYTGAVVDRSYGKFGIDLAGVEHKAKVAMLVDHDGTRRAGFSDKLTVTDRGVELEGMLSSSTDAGREVSALLKEGFPWELSVGIQVLSREEVGEGQKVELNGETVEGPISIARATRLKEVSFLFSGADRSTYAEALASLKQKEAPVADPRPAPKADTREDLKVFLAAFPGEEALAAVRFAEGKSATDVKLEIAVRNTESLKTLQLEHEKLTAERDELLAKLKLLEKLEADAGSPGLGFTGTPEDKSKEALAPTTYDEAWKANEALQSEFGNSKRAFDAYVKREQPSLKELV